MHQIQDERIKLATCRLPEGADWRRQHEGAYNLLNGLLCEQGFESASLGELSREAFGKPYYTGAPKLSFSVTHTNDFCAAAISTCGRLGIDAERIRGFSQKSAIRVLSALELSFLRESSAPEADFFTLWTLKESYSKALGGRLLDMPACGVVFDLRGGKIKASADGAFFECCLCEDIVLSVCLLPR